MTHALIGAGAARHIAPSARTIPQLSLAGVVASLIMDADSWLYLIGPEYYGRYHRVASHSLPGLVTLGVITGVAVWGLMAVRRWRRFGWFVAESLSSGDETPPRVSPIWFIVVGVIAALLHGFFDLITAFGNMLLLWPWSARDFSLGLVNSFDPFLFGITLIWHVVLRQVSYQWLTTAAWMLLVVVYLSIRAMLGMRGVW